MIQASEPCVNGNNDGNDGGGGGHSVHYLVKIWNLKVDLGRQIRILEVALVESIDKRSLFDLDTTTNR